ncbi:hypothetical protein [Delftia tsuruhatensis]|uniref:hypothetical protein n=1 Tax=Delftia tsuruhatensis TaxID=180282 RepID=UPI003709DE09
MSVTSEKFDISPVGNHVRVQRSLRADQGRIELDLDFEHSFPRDKLTVDAIHNASLELAIQLLQSMLIPTKDSPTGQ